MNRNERRRLAKQSKKVKSGAGGTTQLSGPVIAQLEQAIQFQSDGKLNEAESCYRQILLEDPDNIFANHLLGVVLLQTGDPLAAIELIEKALAHDPKNPEMLSNLAAALVSLGNIYLGDSRCDKAEQAYRAALKINPQDFVTYGNLGIALQFLENMEPAKDCYQKALDINPDYVVALKNMGNALMCEGALEDAAVIYDRAISLNPDDTGLRVSRSMFLPVIPSSVAEIDHYRALLITNMDALIAAGGSLRPISEPSSEVGVTGFYLAYDALNDVPYVKKITEMYRTLCPALTWTADHCQPSAGATTGGKYRIGLLSRHFRNHTIGKLYQGFIEHLDRDRFEVIVFRTGTDFDQLSEAINAAADRVIPVPENLEVAQRLVANEKLDLLFYPDVGMDAFTYYLAYARLAPVQATSWGHPVSTGIPNMDYFISSKDLEGDDGDDHYTETLVRLKNPPSYYERPEKPEKTMSRMDFGLPEDANLYLCPQTLFKFHPNYDAVLGNILKSDPNGRLIIIEGRYKNKQRLLCERFAKSFPDHMDQLLFVPRMTMDKFLQLILNADVMLDPMFFGGGNSSSEAIAMGAPIVTLAGDYLRDRVTYAFYKAMGFEDLIARDVDDYVEMAVRLATDKAWRAEMVEKLNSRSDRLFENMETVRELEQFFVAAIEARRKNEPVIKWSEYHG